MNDVRNDALHRSRLDDEPPPPLIPPKGVKEDTSELLYDDVIKSNTMYVNCERILIIVDYTVYYSITAGLVLLLLGHLSLRTWINSTLIT